MSIHEFGDTVMSSAELESVKTGWAILNNEISLDLDNGMRTVYPYQIKY